MKCCFSAYKPRTKMMGNTVLIYEEYKPMAFFHVSFLMFNLVFCIFVEG